MRQDDFNINTKNMYNTLNILTVALQLQVNIHLNDIKSSYTWPLNIVSINT